MLLIRAEIGMSTTFGAGYQDDWPDCAAVRLERENVNNASEYSYGDGLTPPGKENVSPADGGRYHGKTPPPEPRVSVGRA